MSKVFTMLGSPSTGRSTWRTVIYAAVHGQTASKINIVSVVDAPFPPSWTFAHVKEAQMDKLHNAYALEHVMIV